MREVRYVTGDATQPQAAGLRIIAHVCNNMGLWGSGFVTAVSARWPWPEQEYRRWHEGGPDFRLGYTQLVQVDSATWVANMIAQHRVAGQADDGLPPVRYRALSQCLHAVGDEALRMGSSVHMPRIGCGLAGGSWEIVGPLITLALCERGVPVTVYDLPAAS